MSNITCSPVIRHATLCIQHVTQHNSFLMTCFIAIKLKLTQIFTRKLLDHLWSPQKVIYISSYIHSRFQFTVGTIHTKREISAECLQTPKHVQSKPMPSTCYHALTPDQQDLMVINMCDYSHPDKISNQIKCINTVSMKTIWNAIVGSPVWFRFVKGKAAFLS